jgi:hypothetical protein
MALVEELGAIAQAGFDRYLELASEHARKKRPVKSR